MSPYEDLLDVGLVALRSNGGRYQDVPFIAGWITGMISARLVYSEKSFVVEVFNELIQQLDLLAMAAGYTTTTEPEDTNTVKMTFTKVPPLP